MKRTICVQEANEVDIVFQDRTYTATFNMRSVLYLQDELSKIGVAEIPYEHFAALALYAGIKVNHPDYTLEEANALALTRRPYDLQEIMGEYSKAANGIDLKAQDERTKKMIAQILRGAVGPQKI